jgi:hypothetical protein
MSYIFLLSHSGIQRVKPSTREHTMAKNCEMKVENNILTVTVDLTKDFGKSASGKTNIIATTEGNISVPESDSIKIGLNVYKKP